MPSFDPGDQIMIGIGHHKVPFKHHGIYVGNACLKGDTPIADGVVHFKRSPSNPFDVRIVRTNLRGFTDTPNKIQLVGKPPSGRSSDEVVRAALEAAERYKNSDGDLVKEVLSGISRAFSGKSYDMGSFNCEHLATECRLGYGQSGQGDLYKMILMHGPAIKKAVMKG